MLSCYFTLCNAIILFHFLYDIYRRYLTEEALCIEWTTDQNLYALILLFGTHII